MLKSFFFHMAFEQDDEKPNELQRLYMVFEQDDEKPHEFM